MITPKAVTYEWRGIDEGWVVMFDETFSGSRVRGDFARIMEGWVNENKSGLAQVYWSGEVAFAHEGDAMLCLLTFK